MQVSYWPDHMWKVVTSSMSVYEPNYVLLKTYYGIEVILHIDVKQYRNFELTNITQIIRISTIVYTPSVKL